MTTPALTASTSSDIIYIIRQQPEPRQGVRRFVSDLPDHKPLLQIICRVARERDGLEFSGHRVYEEALRQRVPVLNNLGILVTRYGVLEKVGPSTARGAYYRVIDLDAVADEVNKLPKP